MTLTVAQQEDAQWVMSRLVDALKAGHATLIAEVADSQVIMVSYTTKERKVKRKPNTAN